MKNSAAESQIASFLAKYTPEIAAQLSEARDRLRAKFPQGYELVFDNYNALVFGISPSERSTESFISVAGYPKWVTLFFLDGTSLQDPQHLLQGDGKQIRSVRLANAAQLDAPEIEALLAQARAAHAQALQAAPPLSTVVKMVAAKQRPRRPATKA